MIKTLNGDDNALIGAPYTYINLNIQVNDVQRILLDKITARLNLIAHQNRENLVRLDDILDLDLQKDTVFRVHGGLPELFRVHLSQTFIALNCQPLFGIFEEEVEQILMVGGLKQHLPSLLLDESPTIRHRLHDPAVVVHQKLIFTGREYRQRL